MKFWNTLCGVVVALGLSLAPKSAFATELPIHTGDWYCGECTFVDHGQPINFDGNVFIRTAVNPSVTSWMTPNTPRTVMVCNGTSCATYVYSGGTWLQVGEEFPDTHDKEDYKNPEDAPADPPSSGGGGSGGGGLLLPPFMSPGCIFGCGDGKGKVDVGDVENL